MPTLDIRQAKVASQWAHARPLIAVRLDPTGKYAVTSSEDNSLQRWELAATPPTATLLKAHDSWVHALLFSKDGATLVSGGCDGRLIWWPMAEAEPKPIRTIDGHRGWVRNLALSVDGTMMASCGNDRLVVLWNLASGERMFELSAHERDVYTVAFHPDGQHLLSGDLMGKIHIWSLSERKLLRTIDAARFTPMKEDTRRLWRCAHPGGQSRWLDHSRRRPSQSFQSARGGSRTAVDAIRLCDRRVA